MGLIHKKTYKGIETASKIESAKAMFITSKRLFLRSIFSNAKTTNVSKFPTEIKTYSFQEENAAQHSYLLLVNDMM